MAIPQESRATTRHLPIKKRTRNRSYPFQAGFRFIEVMAHLCFHTARLVTRLLANKLARRQVSRHVVFGQFLAELCESLGATFIKLGQILSTRYDLLPQAMLVSLARLQDRITPFPFFHVPNIIQIQLGHPLAEIFAEFEEHPISSASIACVYRARLHTGQQVAVKIRRPDIVRKVSNDLRLMMFLARLLARLPTMRLVPVVEMINELGQYIEQQLDLQIEARNNQHFREQLVHYSQVHIPALVEEYCTESIVVMEFIDDLVRIDELDWEEAEYQTALITGLKALYHMIFLDGVIHCDLHPGNLYLRKGGQVVILDTGFVAKIECEDRRQFAEFFLCIAINSGKKCSEIIYQTALYKPASFDREGFEQAVIELIGKNSGSNAATFQVAPFVAQIFAIQRRFGLRGSVGFTMAILSLLVFEGITKQFYPQLDFQKEARPFLFKAILQKRA